MKRILSGIQPTNTLNLGNYLGAIKNWVPMQKTHECFLMIADLHALTNPPESEVLRRNTREVAATYIACGIDPEYAAIFVQSHITPHAELSWLLSTITSMGWLNRMTQFKDKAGKDKEAANLGLYAYPVLMAADILLYQATHVPVGEDQKQHLELARDIAMAFNRKYGEFFTVPDPAILGEASRVMSLRDGSKKMSKSDPSDMSRINLTDDADTISSKIKKATSDSELLPDNLAALENRAEARNLINIYAALSDRSAESVVQEFAGQGFGKFKPALAELCVEKLSPISTRLHALMQDTAALDALLAKGAERARMVADKTLREAKQRMGLLLS
ncbi:MAG TPA: tryptophan--tRNA ligase [Alphaproteobacteria bacterium]|nr:tryptophan--tRNA ligase [Rhodospirillaceae bacterium]HRJ13053.1 tryptophan--tRNA ligase [Alphaproteobacteria bacterium]